MGAYGTVNSYSAAAGWIMRLLILEEYGELPYIVDSAVSDIRDRVITSVFNNKVLSNALEGLLSVNAVLETMKADVNENMGYEVEITITYNIDYDELGKRVNKQNESYSNADATITTYTVTPDLVVEEKDEFSAGRILNHVYDFLWTGKRSDDGVLSPWGVVWVFSQEN